MIKILRMKDFAGRRPLSMDELETLIEELDGADAGVLDTGLVLACGVDREMAVEAIERQLQDIGFERCPKCDCWRDTIDLIFDSESLSFISCKFCS